jgi:DNA-binding CsgD family transcriptional regulator
VGLGAVLDLRRVQARLRPYGIRSGSHAAHRRATTGWEALTATEHAIAALIAEGRSNPDIASRLLVSPRTVATHVAHTLTKLQVRSRLDIAREVARHETVNLGP